jgi:tRNA(Ile)-lysidine synthase
MRAGRRLLVAVSGGGDSAALLHLLATLGSRDLVVATVDHGLREGSAAEAEEVARASSRYGFRHHTLRWKTGAAGPALQERARAARYALLAECAERENCCAILTAHTADDQAETVFMRLMRGSGPAGLKAMAPKTCIASGAGAPISLLRPLLWARRTALAALLEAEGIVPLEDPSNDDPFFERVRVRALLAALEAQAIVTVEALGETARRCQIADGAAAAAENAAFRAAGGWFSRLGAIALEPEADLSQTPGLAARLIHAASGEERAPDGDAAHGAFRAALDSGAATLGGALIKRKGGTLWVMREPAALCGRQGVDPLRPLAIDPGLRRVWDGRFILTNRGARPLQVRPLGPDGLAALGDRRALYDAPDAALIGAPEVLFYAQPVEVQLLAEERFFGSVLRFPEV